jgi:hypothetical protein
MGSRINVVFVPLFRGHLVKYNYILIFYNIDRMDPVAADLTNVPGADAAGAADAADVAKTCVTALAAPPTEDGKYVMFANDTGYKVFTKKGEVTEPADIDMAIADAKFFKVLPDKTDGGKRKKQQKSAKKQQKSAKKQQKSSKKQRKSRGSRRSKK